MVCVHVVSVEEKRPSLEAAEPVEPALGHLAGVGVERRRVPRPFDHAEMTEEFVQSEQVTIRVETFDGIESLPETVPDVL